MNPNRDIARAVRRALFVGAVATAGVGTPPAYAQDQGQSAEQEAQTIVVTGSRIRRVDEEGPSPVVTITADELADRGYNTVLEAVNDLPQNAGGGFDQQFTFGFTPSASAVDLRGFGLGRSLVLIDGRRVPVFPLAFSGTDNFVDLSSIPVGAIERIEVLTDGASAIYGSDAISGVVNIILKDTTEDELTLRYSDTTQGGGAQTRLQFATGLEGADGSTALFFLEYFKQNEMMFADRSYARSDVLGGIGGPGPGIFSTFSEPGNFIGVDDSVTPAPNCSTTGGSPGIVDGFCRFNRAQYRELLPDMDHFSITAKLNKPVAGDALNFFARATYFTSNVITQIEPVPADTTIVPAANPNNPAGVDGFWLRRTAEFGPRGEEIDNDTYNIVAGLQGNLFDGRFNWELGAQYAEQRITDVSTGYFRADGFDQAVTTGVVDLDGDGTLDPINLFEPIPQAVVDAIRVEPRTDGLSAITSADFQITGDVFDMPAGPAQIAVVAEYAKQRFEDRRDPDVLAGNVEGLGGSAGGGDRKYAALGVELELPIIETLTVNLAGRYDNYDDATDVGGAFSPRIAVQYRPIPNLLLRATAGESFRAPDLQRVFGAETTAFTDLIDTPRCIADGGTGRGDANVPSCVNVVQSVEIRTGSNLELQEEEGDNVSLGVVWEILPGLSMSADFWYIKLEQIVNTPEEQFILDQNALTGDFADAIQRDTVGCDLSRNPGCLDIVSAQARNLSFQRARGVDSTLQYRLPTENLGEFSFRLGATYLDKLEIQEAEGEPVVNVLSEGQLGEFVRFKGNVSAGWTRGPWSGLVFVNHIGSFTPDDPTIVDEVGSYTTVNLSGSYAFPWQGRVQLGVNNIFDKDPPFDLSDGDSAQPFYNQFFHDPLGSTWWLAYSQQF